MVLSETDFISNQTALAINQAAQSIDLNPMSGMFTENMWTHISEGMNYSNELRYEIARKLKHLEQLKRQEEDLNKDLDMAPLKERIEELKNQIEKANERVETVEIQQESLCYMINVKRKDNLIGWQKFQKQYKPLQWANKAIEKQLDEIMTMDKMLQKQGVLNIMNYKEF